MFVVLVLVIVIYLVKPVFTFSNLSGYYCVFVLVLVVVTSIVEATF